MLFYISKDQEWRRARSEEKKSAVPATWLQQASKTKEGKERERKGRPIKKDHE